MKPNDKAIEAAIRYLEAPMSAREQMEQILTAAYAAQFQSEEYAELVKELRDGIIEHRRRFAGDTHDDLGGTADYEKTHAMTNRAADALEAVLAERDALAARLAPVGDEPRHLTTDEQKVFHSALRRSAKIKKPVDDEALVEIAAVYCSPEMNWE